MSADAQPLDADAENVGEPLAEDDEMIIVTVSGGCNPSKSDLLATLEAADSTRAKAHVSNALAELRRGGRR